MISSGIKNWNWKLRTCLGFQPFGSRSVVVSITIFYHGSLRACLPRNISRNREIKSRAWAILCKMWKKTLVDLQKRFPIYHGCCKFYYRGLAIPLVHEEEEVTLVELEREIFGPLRTDSTSLKWFSTNFLIKNSSSRNSCSLFNSSKLFNTSFSICQFFVK